MKPERAFIADRPLAQHCPELLRAGPAPAELTPTLTKFGDRLARAFASGLVRIWGNDALEVSSNPPRECTMSELASEIAPLAANTLVSGGTRDERFLASVDAEAVLRLVDRAFGGSGEAPAEPPEAFPLSAELLISRLETLVVRTLEQALDAKSEGAIRALRRDGSLTELAPFADSEPLLVVTLDIEEAERAPWHVTFALPAKTAGDLFGKAEQPRAAGSGNRAVPAADEEPFGDIPLTLCATLVDMRIPFSSLSTLKPGQLLPVAVARSVPLTIGDKVVAHGTVGEMDDRVAVQITHAF
ncbi:MAG: FliM/FliN family flagellar motor switch protein [Novosphingobium sp.]|nr:FliM/FliN family flagellar motor switch protein [Novosphingobium sp.]MCP5401084.1 FliM/FliN family flagellar motor switch protein [Novosphingobium sp.]